MGKPKEPEKGSAQRALRSAALAPVREAWPELTLDDVHRVGVVTPPKAPTKDKDTTAGGVSDFARHVRSINGIYDPRQFDAADWSRLAALLGDPTEGLRGTFLCRTDGRSPSREVEDEYKDHFKEKERKNKAKEAQGKARDDALIEQDDPVTEKDWRELSGQVTAAFSLDEKAATWIVWAAFESLPVIGVVLSLFNSLKVSVQVIKQIVDQLALSGLEATSVSVIEHEALKGAYALGKGELKRLSAELGKHLASVGAGIVGLDGAIKITAQLLALAVRCYLLILEQVRLHELNTWLTTADFTGTDGRKRLRDHPELAIYLPFLPGSAAACVLGILPPGALRPDAPINRVIDELEFTGVSNNNIAQSRTLARASAAADDARLVGELVVAIAARNAPQPRWLLSRWDPIPLKDVKTDKKLQNVQSAYERLYRVLRMMEKAQSDCPLKLYRGRYDEYWRLRRIVDDPLAGMTPVHAVHQGNLTTKGIEAMWSVFGTAKPGDRPVAGGSAP